MGCAQSQGHSTEHVESIATHATSARIVEPVVAWRETGFHDDYKVSEKLGAGSFASVYAACKVHGSKEVAVKVTDLRESKTEHFDTEKLHEKFLRETTTEVSVLKLLSGEQHVVTLLDSYLSRGLSYLVLERCELTLWKALTQTASLTEVGLKGVLHQMLAGIAATHTVGIVHCDVKPDKFLVCTSGPKQVVKLCDFGLARQLESSDDSAVGLRGVYGTTPYMAPEMLQGDVYGTKIDTWSFGCVAYTLLHGQFPYMPKVLKPSDMKIAIVQGKPEPSYEPKDRWTGRAPAKAPALSSAAKAFLKKLLCRQPALRLSAADALEDQFWKVQGSNVSLRSMLYSARSVGAFGVCDVSSCTTEVDRRLSHLQEQQHGALVSSSNASTASGRSESLLSHTMDTDD